MRVEVAVPVWGAWAYAWTWYCLPALRQEAADIGARIVAYTLEEDRSLLTGAGVDECRPLPALVEGSTMDRADLAHADALDRALAAGDVAVAPLSAALMVGRGTLGNALGMLAGGCRAAMACTLSAALPSDFCMTAARMSSWLARTAPVGEWRARADCPHPGHYAWRAGDAVLLRHIFVHPVLLWPRRSHTPVRAVDHFMAEGYLADYGDVGFLDPHEGCTLSIPTPASARAPSSVPARPMFTEDHVVAWMVENLRPWNVRYMGARFWLGRCEDQRLAARVQEVSDTVVDRLQRGYAERMFLEGQPPAHLGVYA